MAIFQNDYLVCQKLQHKLKERLCNRSLIDDLVNYLQAISALFHVKLATKYGTPTPTPLKLARFGLSVGFSPGNMQGKRPKAPRVKAILPPPATCNMRFIPKSEVLPNKSAPNFSRRATWRWILNGGVFQLVPKCPIFVLVCPLLSFFRNNKGHLGTIWETLPT